MHILGELSLNLSLVIYFVVYFPQLWHNRSNANLAQMSLGFHAILMVAATCDLYYGFGRIVQWQYELVSILFFLCILVQHFQLARSLSVPWYRDCYFAPLSFFLIIFWFILLLLFPLAHRVPGLFVSMGWIERLGYLAYCVPQIIKQFQFCDQVRAISPWFIVLTLLTSILDTISAWAFHWGSSSLYGTPLSILLHFILLWQIYRFKKQSI